MDLAAGGHATRPAGPRPVGKMSPNLFVGDDRRQTVWDSGLCMQSASTSHVPVSEFPGELIGNNLKTRCHSPPAKV